MPVIRRRTAGLACALVLAAGAYAGLVGAHRSLLERDYSAIADPHARVGYCMASSLFHGEKSTIAESLARPADPELYRRILPKIMSGEATRDKVLAGRALFDRDELRARSALILSRVAKQCGHETAATTQREELLALAVVWLERDLTFLSMYAQSRARMPDAADRFDAGVPDPESRGRSRQPPSQRRFRTSVRVPL
jgi:hypothetical protein